MTASLAATFGRFIRSLPTPTPRNKYRLWHTDYWQYALKDGHQFQWRKFAASRILVKGAVTKAGLDGKVLFDEPPSAPSTLLSHVHGSNYTKQVFTGTLPRNVVRTIGFGYPAPPGMATRAARSVGATLAASVDAWSNREFSANLGGGTHHAGNEEKGPGGYCVFNDVGVSTVAMMSKFPEIQRVLIVDLDVHQGDGSASIFKNHPNVFTFDMYAEKNFPFRKILPDIGVPVPDGVGDDHYMHSLDAALPAAMERVQPDLMYFLAGVDVLESDKLGRLNLTMDGLRRRNDYVFDLAKAYKVPLVLCKAGGYSSPPQTTNRAHASCYLDGLRAYTGFDLELPPREPDSPDDLRTRSGPRARGAE